MSNQHSPFPWRSYAKDEITIITASDDKTIAKVASKQDVPLILSAPKVLAALKALSAAAKRARIAAGGQVDSQMTGAMMLAEQAIREAEG